MMEKMKLNSMMCKNEAEDGYNGLLLLPDNDFLSS